MLSCAVVESIGLAEKVHTRIEAALVPGVPYPGYLDPWIIGAKLAG